MHGHRPGRSRLTSWTSFTSILAAAVECRSRATRCITANTLQTNVDITCDGLTFSSYLSKVANFKLLHLHLAVGASVANLRVTPCEFCRHLRQQKTKTPWAIVRRCLRDPTFSRFSRTPTCDRQTDRQTHDYSIYRVGMASRGKN